ncbi:hypothetical protein LguiB_009082 [Lonicera macranthoides]
MAQISNLHPFHHQQDENPSPVQTLASIPNYYPHNNNNNVDLFPFDFNSLSPPNLSFFLPSSSLHFHNPLSDYSNSQSDTDSDFDSDSLAYTMNYVTDLFESTQDSVSDPFGDSINNDFRVFDYDDFDLNHFDELGFGVESSEYLNNSSSDGLRVSRIGSDSDSMNNEIDFRVFESGGSNDFDLNHIDELGLGFELSEYPKDLSCDGLRIVSIESDSDSDEQYAISRVSEDGLGRGSDTDLPIFWTGGGELDWEEVSGRVDDREGPSSVIDRIEELSVSSQTYSEESDEIGEEAVRDLEWEVLLAVNNFERSIEFLTNGENDDYVYDTNYDALFGHFLESENALKANPPAAKTVVENLPLVMLTKEKLGKNSVVCAVCKDDILVEETVTQLPCCHYYHGDCILPWLRLRNTCPVCRFELPTDDAEYERRKNGPGDLGLLDDSGQIQF